MTRKKKKSTRCYRSKRLVHKKSTRCYRSKRLAHKTAVKLHKIFKSSYRVVKKGKCWKIKRSK